MVIVNMSVTESTQVGACTIWQKTKGGSYIDLAYSFYQELIMRNIITGTYTLVDR